MMYRKIKFIIIILQGVFLYIPNIAQAEEVRDITFPIESGYDSHFSDTWGAARSGGRSHIGTDIMTDKMTPLVAAVDGRITYLVDKDQGWGLALYIKGNDGYSYRYLHVNNDTPGTDDGKDIRAYAFPKNIVRGSQVRAGQIVAFAGDSGNAEYTGSHLHFEIWTSGEKAINSYPSLMSSIDSAYVLKEDIEIIGESQEDVVSSYNFSRDLELGDKGQDVQELQKYLNTAGFVVALTGAGSKGNETTYFGPATERALVKFQQAQGISPAVGYFGSITRAKISSNTITGAEDQEVEENIVSIIQASWLVKEKNSPKVYYVDDNLNLRWLTSEAAAISRFGNTWVDDLKIINDLSQYEVGRDLN